MAPLILIFSFHEKKEIVKECLKQYDAAFFLDADVVIVGGGGTENDSLFGKLSRERGS